MNKRLQDLLLEFDPKQERRRGLLRRPIRRPGDMAKLKRKGKADKAKGRTNLGHSPAGAASTDASLASFARGEGHKIRKKAENRALARGGQGDKATVFTDRKKLSGPKGKLPEAIEQALLEYDPGKDKDIKSKQLVGRAFNREAKKGDFKRANKAKNRQVARGSGDVLGSGKNKLVRKDIARDIRNLNRKTRATLGN